MLLPRNTLYDHQLFYFAIPTCIGELNEVAHFNPSSCNFQKRIVAQVIATI